MNKKVKKVVVLLAVIILTIPLFTHANVNPNADPNSQRNNGHNEEVYCEIYQEIFESRVEYFGYEFVRNHAEARETIEEIEDFFRDTRSDMVVYPDYFGGMYVNEYGELVLLKVASEYKGYCEPETFYYFTDTLVEEVEFSYNELIEVMDLLDDKFDEWSSQIRMSLNIDYYDNPEVFDRDYLSSLFPSPMHNVAAWSLGVAGNHITVYLIEYTPETIEEFRSYIFDSPTLVFQPDPFEMVDFTPEQPFEPANERQPPQEYVEGIARTTARTILPGDRLSVWRWTNRSRNEGYLVGGQRLIGSIGYRATLTRIFPGIITFRDYGFVTAAHLGNPELRVDDVILCRDDVIIGRVILSALLNFDVAFVRLYDPNRVSRLPNDPAFRQGVMGGRLGDSVSMRGGVSGWRHGQITHERISFSNPWQQFRNVSMTSIMAQRGDSGSPIYVMHNGNIQAVVGFLVGERTYGGRLLTVVTRADVIANMMNIEIRPRY